MNLIIVTAVYNDPYEPYSQKEIIAICSSIDQVDLAIQAYKDRKIRNYAECLLVNTTFETRIMVLDAIQY